MGTLETGEKMVVSDDENFTTCSILKDHNLKQQNNNIVQIKNRYTRIKAFFISYESLNGSVR